VLSCPEPIDPTSLHDAAFSVDAVGQGEGAKVRLKLLRNFDDDQVEGDWESRALLALEFDRVLAPGTYQVFYDNRLGSVTDFRGNFVGMWLWRNPVTFRVGFEEDQGETTLDFIDDRDALPLVIEGSDGTAHWSDSGRVTIRYPAAAGHGVLGALELTGAGLPAQDLHTTRITLAPNVEQGLTGAGLVVLRAQGRIELSGRLVRRAGAPAQPMFPPLASLVSNPPRRTTLTDFLERAEADGSTWTVIVAGGDLVVDGTLEVDTPLLLVSGGRVRGLGSIKPTGAARDQVWQLGDGSFESKFQSPEHAAPRPAPALVMDAPLVNNLRTSLVYSVVSSPQPRRSPPGTWIELEAICRPPAQARVHFAPRDLEIGDTVRRAVLAVRPWELGGDGPCRVVIELLIGPALAPDDAQGQPQAWTPPLEIDDGRLPPWDPPFVDRVRLVWSRH
jgi:hypothetical protein